jgi:reactive intermediate/imine deaminase
MAAREPIHTDKAPQAIGPYSQAVRVGSTVYLSGQIPLDPATMTLDNASIEHEIRRVFANLLAVVEAAGGSAAQIAKLNLYLTDLGDFGTVNAIMAELFDEPFPARAAIGVSALPKGARFEAEGVLVLED